MATKPPIEEKPKLVRLELEPKDHTALRVAAAKAGLSMAMFARGVILAAIQEPKKK